MDTIDRMLEHDRWATNHLLTLCENLTDDQLDQEFDIGLRSIRATFDHMSYVTVIWTALMMQQPPTIEHEAEKRDRSLPALVEREEAAHNAFATYARKARDEGRLDETYEDLYGLPPSIGGTIIHVAMHNEVHRSEIVHMLTRIGVPDEPPEVDHLLWEHVLNGRTTP